MKNVFAISLLSLASTLAVAQKPEIGAIQVIDTNTGASTELAAADWTFTGMGSKSMRVLLLCKTEKATCRKLRQDDFYAVSGMNDVLSPYKKGDRIGGYHVIGTFAVVRAGTSKNDEWYAIYAVVMKN